MESKNRLYGGPTKTFFVNMLTRDIDLSDSILDLLDNSVDGAIRNVPNREKRDRPYEGFSARITLSEEGFEIADNCGGIPKRLYEYAFALGRPDSESDTDSELSTIGTYGIGMKRAIFKIGWAASVESHSDDLAFRVSIDRDWMTREAMEDSEAWFLPFERLHQKAEQLGTRVEVYELREGVKNRFSGNDFVGSLRQQISQHYGYIIQKGFEIVVNDEVIEPVGLDLRLDPQVAESKAGIAPFMYSSTLAGVEIRIAIGFYEAPKSTEELEESAEGPIRSQEQAGISVVCNDRVILYNDKSKRTGWGLFGTPYFHNQFNTIAGICMFSSSNARKLPLTTTKRGIDGDSEVYLTALNELARGLKRFTRYTNEWKTRRDENAKNFKNTERVPVLELSKRIPETSYKPTREGAKRFSPPLPQPKEDDPKVSILFQKPTSQVEEISQHFFGKVVANSQVGAYCFDSVLKGIRETK